MDTTLVNASVTVVNVALVHDQKVVLVHVARHPVICHALRMYLLVVTPAASSWLVGYIYVHNVAILESVEQ